MASIDVLPIKVSNRISVAKSNGKDDNLGEEKRL